MKHLHVIALPLLFLSTVAHANNSLPNATEIRDALQREINGRIARFDALAAQCKNLNRNSNPMAAMMCLMSGGGAVTSQTLSAKVNSVNLDECVRSKDGVSYCRYSAKTTIQGSGFMRQMADFGNALGAMGGWTYSSFVHHGGAWHFKKTYDSCDWGGDGIHCSWTEYR